MYWILQVNSIQGLPVHVFAARRAREADPVVKAWTVQARNPFGVDQIRA